MDTRHRVPVFFGFTLMVMLLTGSSYAIPAFSHQYGTSGICTDGEDQPSQLFL